jgi:thioredoxin reductase
MEDFDVAVIGAGSAGLQAALTLGRMRRHVAVFSTGHFRNDPAAHMHNFLGHDGRPPAELRRAARRDLDRYPTVHFVEQEVTSVDDRTDGFVLTMRGHAAPLRVRRVILATGIRDSCRISPASPSCSAMSSPTAPTATGMSSPTRRSRS